MATEQNLTDHSATVADIEFPGPDPYAPLKDLPTFTLTSADFTDGQRLPDTIAEPGGGLSPQLSWSGLPEGTKSIAITCFDPDAPTASGYWHWGVFNIPVDVTELPTGAGAENSTDLPAQAIQLPGDSLKRGHYGANPPSGHGPHRYMYAVHAVDVPELDIPEDMPVTVLGFNLYFHSLGRAIITGWYEQ